MGLENFQKSSNKKFWKPKIRWLIRKQKGRCNRNRNVQPRTSLRMKPLPFLYDVEQLRSHYSSQDPCGWGYGACLTAQLPPLPNPASSPPSYKCCFPVNVLHPSSISGSDSVEPNFWCPKKYIEPGVQRPPGCFLSLISLSLCVFASISSTVFTHRKGMIVIVLFVF